MYILIKRLFLLTTKHIIQNKYWIFVAVIYFSRLFIFTPRFHAAVIALYDNYKYIYGRMWHMAIDVIILREFQQYRSTCVSHSNINKINLRPSDQNNSNKHGGMITGGLIRKRVLSMTSSRVNLSKLK